MTADYSNPTRERWLEQARLRREARAQASKVAEVAEVAARSGNSMCQGGNLGVPALAFGMYPTQQKFGLEADHDEA